MPQIDLDSFSNIYLYTCQKLVKYYKPEKKNAQINEEIFLSQ